MRTRAVKHFGLDTVQIAARREFHVAVVIKKKVARVCVLALAGGSRCWGRLALFDTESSSGYW